MQRIHVQTSLNSSLLWQTLSGTDTYLYIYRSANTWTSTSEVLGLRTGEIGMNYKLWVARIKETGKFKKMLKQKMFKCSQ